MRLFDRAHRRVVLTPEGARYAASVAEALAILRSATRRLSANRADGPLAMTLSPAFALRWLLPRLARFQKRHPDIELRFVSTSDVHDFRTGDLDLAVRYGRGDWPGLEAEWLIALDATAVCTPEVVAGGPPLDEPADVARRVRIHVENRPRRLAHVAARRRRRGGRSGGGSGLRIRSGRPGSRAEPYRYGHRRPADSCPRPGGWAAGRALRRPHAVDGRLLPRLSARQRGRLAPPCLPRLDSGGDCRDAGWRRDRSDRQPEGQGRGPRRHLLDRRRMGRRGPILTPAAKTSAPPPHFGWPNAPLPTGPATPAAAPVARAR